MFSKNYFSDRIGCAAGVPQRILQQISSRNPGGDNSWGSPQIYHGWPKMKTHKKRTRRSF